MPCDDRREYIAPPITGDVAQLPAVPTANNWIGLMAFLQQVKNVLEGQSTNPIRPDAIKNFTVATTDSGTQLVWDPDKNSAFYAVYRHDDNVFAHSRVIATVHASGGSQRPGFFDVAGQDEVLSTRVYWVRGFSATGVPGPLSTQTITVDAGVIPGDRPWTETLTPGEVRLVEQNNADPVVIRSYGTATPTLSLYRANGTEDSPLPVLGGDELGQIQFGGLSPDGTFSDLARIIAIAAADSVDSATYVTGQSQLGGDSINGSWSSGGVFYVPGMCVVGDDIFVGVAKKSAHGASGTSGATVWRYSISGNTWTNITPAGTIVAISNMIHYSGKIYYAVQASLLTGSVKAYDIAGGTTADLGAANRGWSNIAIDAATGNLYAGDDGVPAHVDRYNIPSPAGWTTIWSTILGSIGVADVIYSMTFEPVSGLLFMGIQYNPNPSPVTSRLYSWNGTSWTNQWQSGKEYLPSMVSYASFVYIGTSDGEVWEYNPDTDALTKIAGDGLNDSWTSTNPCYSLYVSPDEFTVYAGIQNGSSRGELWHFTPSFGGLIAGTWQLFDTAAVGYESIRSTVIDAAGNLYAGLGHGTGDGDFWGLGTVTSTPVGFSNLEIQMSQFGTDVTLGKFFYNGDIAFGMGLDRIYWDESADMLGIKTTTPTRTLDLAGTDGMHMAIGSPSTPASGDIYLAVTTGILTWHDGTAARRTVHAPAALTTLNLIKGEGGVTGVQTTGIAVSSVDAITGVTLLGLEDTDASHNMSIKWNENDSANRTLNILLGGASRSLTFTADAVIGGTQSGTNTGDVTLAGSPDYITIANQVITRALINLATHITGDLPYSNLTPASAATLLLGRGGSGGAGDWQEITLGTNLSMAGTVLNASGGGGGGSGPIAAQDAYMSTATATITSEQDLTGASTSLTTDGDWVITGTWSVGVSGGPANVTMYLNYDGSNEAQSITVDILDGERHDFTRQWIITVASQPKTAKLRIVKNSGAGTVTAYGNNVGTVITALFLGSAAHAANHENGGADEIDVTGLSGVLGDPQTPADHASDHYDGGGDEIDIVQLGGFPADDQLFLDGSGAFSTAGWRLVGTSAAAGFVSTGLWVFASNVTEVIFTGLGGWSEILVLTRLITKSVSGTTALTVSIDGGSSFLTTSGDYVRVAAAGTEANTTNLGLHTTNATAARSGAVRISGWNQTSLKRFHEENRMVTDTTWGWIPTANALDALRIFPSAGGNITGGSITIYGR